jgi:hypothetical protein
MSKTLKKEYEAKKAGASLTLKIKKKLIMFCNNFMLLMRR